MQKVIEAAGFILFTRSAPVKFLLMKHSNRWDLPKGHAEANESLLATALRETEEETGIPASEIAVDPSFQYVMEYTVENKKRGNYLKRVTYLLGRVEKPVEVHLTEHIGFEWFPWPPASSIQKKTIDPLLAHVAEHFNGRENACSNVATDD